MSPSLAGGFFTTEPPGKPPRNLFLPEHNAMKDPSVRMVEWKDDLLSNRNPWSSSSRLGSLLMLYQYLKVM